MIGSPSRIGKRLQQAVLVLACVLVLKVTIGIVLLYPNYLPPDFTFGFLQGRQSYFWDGYHWAFYVHIVSGPCTLLIGMALMSARLRLRYPWLHRILGRIQTASVVLLVVPSGIWMARYADTGMIAGFGFASLAIATGFCALMGWRSALNRRFVEHRRWMWRCYLLLCSAIILRLIGGLFTVLHFDGMWTYALAAWLSWLLPIGVFEFIEWRTSGGSSVEHRKENQSGFRSSDSGPQKPGRSALQVWGPDSSQGE